MISPDLNPETDHLTLAGLLRSRYITAMGQFSVSKAVQLQRRTLEYAMTNGYNCKCSNNH